ncbi:MAG: dockerin type I repeat-containing protein, partial [Clostridia bacterium]|nr:dockerin type I repeat-containing protein [Clostridia bacterium]
YTVSYQNNTGVGTATCTVTGIGDYYTGSKILTFQIVKRDLSDPSVHVSDIPDYQANGSPIVPDLKITCENVELTKGTDYSVELTNNTMPGEAMLKIIGIGSNYSGTITKTFSIYCNHEELQDTTVVKKPTFKEDGTLRGKCTQCGMTVEKAIPKTNYRDINDANVTVQTSFAYSPAKGGVQPKPVLTVDGTTTLEEGVDYTLSYNENDKITSSAEIVITGIKGYGESKSVKFSITSRALSSDGVTVADIKKQAYDKDVPSTPSVTVKCDGVTLKEDTDYKLSYSNNNKIGKATVTINGMGNYSGSITKEFEIFNNSHGIVGDVDGDESLTSADALSILRYSVDLEKFDNTQLGLADVNNDNSVDSADSLSVLRYSVGLIDNSTIGKEK